MGIVQTLVTVGGVLAIIALLALLFCHYLGGWTRTKAWLRSSGEEKMVLTKAGTHRHFNPNGYMIFSADSDLNLSGRGSFRHFDTTDRDYQLHRQASGVTCLPRSHGVIHIPPQPLRPAPVPPSVAAGHLASQSSVDSVFNTAPSSPAILGGYSVPKIPPPPSHHHSSSTSSITSAHAIQRKSNMGDGNYERGGGSNHYTASETATEDDESTETIAYSSTNPFLPMLQSNSQTIQSYSSGSQQDSQYVKPVNPTADSTPSRGSNDYSLDLDGNSSFSRYSTVGSRSASSSVSTLPSNSAGISMGEILFSAAPSYKSNPTDEIKRPNQDNIFRSGSGSVPEHSFGPSSTENSSGSSGGVGAKQASSASPRATSRSSGSSPQHTRYGLYHQASAENINPLVSTTVGIIGASPTPHSPPPSGASGIRRASYPNRKEYMLHDTIPKSEFPQHIPYIPSSHHHHHLHHGKMTTGVTGPPGSPIPERKLSGGDIMAGMGIPYIDSPSGRLLHSYLPSTGAASVQPFLEEEEPPEEDEEDHQLPKHSNLSYEFEREDLTNRIMLETMREEIRIANERMADATKSLMMDEVFLPTMTSGTTSAAATKTTGSAYSSSTAKSFDGGNHKHFNVDSAKKRTSSFAGNLPSALARQDEDDDIPINGKKDARGRIGDTSALTVAKSSILMNKAEALRGSMRRSSVPSARVFSGTGAGRPANLLQQHRQRSNDEELRSASTPPPSYTGLYMGNSSETAKYFPSAMTEAGSISEDEQGNIGQRRGRHVSGTATSANTSHFPSGSQASSSESFGNDFRSTLAQLTAFTSKSNNAMGGNSSFSSVLNNATSTVSFAGGKITGGIGPTASSLNNRAPSLGSLFRQNTRSFSLRQSSTDSVGSTSDLRCPSDPSTPPLQRALSCDSVTSDTSVVLGDLEPSANVTGYLRILLEYDNETADLLLTVIEAKELTGPDPDPSAPFDSYVRIYLLPDKSTNMQTRVYRKSLNPVYKEKFMFGLELAELATRSLVFYLYATDKRATTLIGEAEVRLCDLEIMQPAATWLILTDTGQRGGEVGEIMFSLSYLPTAERLTVVLVKARNLKFPQERETGDPFVKVYLLQREMKVSKKKSSLKRGERNPIFNEALIFSIPVHLLQTIQLRITVADSHGTEGRAYSIGHVIVGAASTGKSLSHWNQMLSSLRKPIAMWHALQTQTNNK